MKKIAVFFSLQFYSTFLFAGGMSGGGFSGDEAISLLLRNHDKIRGLTIEDGNLVESGSETVFLGEFIDPQERVFEIFYDYRLKHLIAIEKSEAELP